MKITFLILLLSGGGLLAQTPAGSDEDSAARAEIMRQAVRQKIAALMATNSPAIATNIKPAVATSNSAVATNKPAVATTPAATPPASPEELIVPAPVRVTAPGVAAELVAPGVVIAPTAAPVQPASAPPALPPAIPVLPTTAAPAAATPVAGVPPPGVPPPVAGAVASPPPAAAVVPPAMPTPPTAKPAEPVLAAGEIDFSDMDLNQVLTFYANLVNRSILKPNALPAQTFSFRSQTPLTRTEAVQAIESVLSMNGITTINVGEKFVKVVPSAQASLEAGAINTMDAKDLPETGQYITQIIPLQNLKPTEIQPLLQSFAKMPNSITPVDPNQLLIIRDNAENIKRMREIIAKLDVAVPAEYESEVIPIKYALATDISSVLTGLGGGGGTSVGHSSTGSSAPGSPGGGLRPGGLNAPGGGMGSPGSPGYNPAAPGATLGGARTTSLQSRLQSIVAKAASSGEFTILNGQTKIIADERTNSLLVFAGKQDMEMIKSIVDKLDTVLAQVLIEAIIMEVTLNDNRELGVSYLQKDASQKGSFTGIGGINNGAFLNRGNFLPSSGTNGGPSIASGLSYFANFGGDFQATLTAAADDSHINILSRPRIQTSHGVQASLQIGDTVPYVTGTYFNGVNGTPSSQYQQTFVGINLQVTPLINPDGLVVMDIVQDVQQLGPTTKIDNNDVPTTTKRTAQAKVSVRDGDTIILGGFISTTKNLSKSGVPFLKDIPGLGLLFSSSSEKKIRQELIVLIRPTVLPTPAVAAIVARRERDKSPALKQVEADSRGDEIREKKAADKIKIPTE